MIFVEQGALDRLAAYVPRPALVVMDVNTEAVAGARVARELGADVLRLPADLHATEDAAAQVRGCRGCATRRSSPSARGR